MKGAFIEQTVYIGDDQIDTLASIKSKDEVIGDIISLLRSPIKNVVSSLQSGGGEIIWNFKITFRKMIPDKLVIHSNKQV